MPSWLESVEEHRLLSACTLGTSTKMREHTTPKGRGRTSSSSSSMLLSGGSSGGKAEQVSQQGLDCVVCKTMRYVCFVVVERSIYGVCLRVASERSFYRDAAEPVNEQLI